MTHTHPLALTFLLAGMPLSVGLCQVNSNENSALPFTVNDVEYMRISGTEGNVGIGTTNPVAKLTVAGNVSVTSMIDVGHTAQSCATAISGSIRYETTSDTLQICTSAGWKSLTSSTTAGASTAASSTGAIQFNSGNAFAGDTPNFFWDDANNRLGIGTSTPSNPLHIIGGPQYSNIVLDVLTPAYSNNILFRASATTVSAWAIGGSVPGTAVTTDFVISQAYEPGWAERLRIVSGTGYVGIGTTAPSSSLHVSSTAVDTASISNRQALILSVSGTAGDSYGALNGNPSGFRIENTSLAPNPQTGVSFYFKDDGNTLRHGAVLVAGRESTGWGAASGDYPGYFAFHTRDTLAAGGANTEKVRITSAGNVGIGTVGPSYKLAVAGSAQIMGGGIDSALGDSIIFNNTGYQSSYFNKIRNAHSAAAAQSIMTFELSSGAASTQEVLRLVGNGNVGIGTASPVAKLQVAGTVSASDAVQVGNSSLTCAAAIAGAIEYESGSLRYCNGSAWTAVSTGTALTDGDKGDITVASSGAAWTIDTGAVTSADIADGAIVNADVNASAAIDGTKINPNFGTQRVYATGGLNPSQGMATATGSLGAFEAQSQGSGGTAGAAFIAFHRPSTYAAYLGLDTDNQFKVGGWSLGAAAYKLWHEGNDGAGSTLDADTVDGLSSASFQSALGYTPVNKAGDTMTGQLQINNGSPTMYFQDTDHYSAMIHNNSNLLYILSGCGVNSTSWCQNANSYWPFYINMTDNNAVFGGNVYAFGYYHNSDARLKKDVRDIPSALDIIGRLRGVTFTWKDSGKKSAGLIAQEVEKVMPEAVEVNGNGHMSVDYDQIVGPLIEAVKELKTDNDNLRDELDGLRRELKRLQ